MQLAYCVFQLILQATPYQAAYAASTVGLVLPYLNALLQLAQGFCLWRGLLAVQLLELGFPDYVLQNLRPEEIEACRGPYRWWSAFRSSTRREASAEAAAPTRCA